MRLFVSIASYCDPVLAFTLRRAVAAAADPRRLHFGVVDQSPAGTPRVAHPGGGCRLSQVRLGVEDARGPCWARAIAMSLHEGEEWFLQLDAHMDFDAGWDERLVAAARALGAPGRPLAISTYPAAFRLVQGGVVRDTLTRGVLAQVVKPGASFEAGHPVLPFQAHPVDTDAPLPAFHVGAGCLFAPGRIVQQFPYDPWLYFHGEEQALALRLYTHGWDVFHIPDLPIHHQYNEPGPDAPARPLHWDAAHDADREVDWWTRERHSRARLARLVAGKDLGVYGLGAMRTLADFAAFSGIDYRARTMGPQAYLPMRARA
ncbi:GlcNAc-transferase family protein [Ramlibacter sp. AN1133]|uniref:GlcNAc-transferase family protein n=1 Tax=Ramlibacter sp. AN1133 TaxID=3133429 RepID=UPI0030C4CDD1